MPMMAMGSWSLSSAACSRFLLSWSSVVTRLRYSTSCSSVAMCAAFLAFGDACSGESELAVDETDDLVGRGRAELAGHVVGGGAGSLVPFLPGEDQLFEPGGDLPG